MSHLTSDLYTCSTPTKLNNCVSLHFALIFTFYYEDGRYSDLTVLPVGGGKETL